jgi:hypothetical protein
MNTRVKNIVFAIPFALLLALVSPASAFAAAPDGNGPWADSVLSTSQGLMKNGNPVPAPRSNPTSALGVAENDTTEGNFYSLGFGGSISLGFDNGISSGVIVVEATNPNYPTETAKVEVSENGTEWVMAGNVSMDGSVNKPESISCARYVRITDTSNPDNFSDETADGYDVDGVQATGDTCTPPTPTPGGNGACNIDVNQSNTTVIGNNISANANTGGNKANKNNGGDTNTTTGNATANVNVTNSAGFNIANLPGCAGGDITATISGNGAGSTNTININSGSKNKKSPSSKVKNVKKTNKK